MNKFDLACCKKGEKEKEVKMTKIASGKEKSPSKKIVVFQTRVFVNGM
jgi:hypothetical protein